MRMTSVRLRLTLWNIGVLALALLTLVVVMKDSVERKIVASVDQNLRREADRVAVHYQALYNPRIGEAIEANRDRISSLLAQLQGLHHLMGNQEAQGEPASHEPQPVRVLNLAGHTLIPPAVMAADTPLSSTAGAEP